MDVSVFADAIAGTSMGRCGDTARGLEIGTPGVGRP